MNNFKSLDQSMKEDEDRLKAIQAKRQTAKRIQEAFPDATIGVLETGGAGTTTYFSASIKPEMDKAKPMIYYSPPQAGQVGNGRFLMRFFVPVGKEKVYSLQPISLGNASVAEMLNKYIAMPSGSAAVADLIPKPIGIAAPKKI